MTGSDDAEFHATLKRARGRVGFTADSASRWLLGAIQTDVTQLDAKRQAALSYELMAFSTYTTFQGEGTQLEVAPIYDWGSLLGAGDPAPPSPSKVKSVLRDLGTQLEDLIDRGSVTLHQIIFPEVRLTRSPSGVTRATAFTGRAEWNLEYAFMKLLLLRGNRMKRCPCCSKLFYRSRLDKEVCSERCRSTYNIRKRRETPPDRFGHRGRPKRQPRNI